MNEEVTMNGERILPDITSLGTKLRWLINVAMASVFTWAVIYDAIRGVLWAVPELRVIFAMIALFGFVYGVNNSIYRND
jgi:hypothetical protein